MRDTALAIKTREPSNQFPDLMDLYEQNYLLTRLLIPELKKLSPGQYVSYVKDCLPLYLVVHDKEKYTTTFVLTYRFNSGIRYPKQPDLTIRVYHDASNAEVVSGLLHGQRHSTRISRSLQTSWKINRFLYKWMRYCLHRGHQFTVQS